MLLLTAPIFKSSCILTGIYFIFLKNVLDQTYKTLDTKFRAQWKDRQKSYQARQNLALFSNLDALILNWNCVKSLIVIKTVQKLSLKGTGKS